MKAEELRIGNWVLGVLTKEPIEIDWICLKHLIDGNIQNVYNPNIKVYEPIQLTEEWLYKFNFEQYHDNPRLERFYVLKTGYYPFQVYVERDFRIYWQPNTRLEHVHQLQNLYFALTGSELTLSLPEK